ncbi:MAG: efflux RND transporter permease subunit, partial [Candidatus Solibacter usitatus]|nr:efflux RND transporter permease subunit [Candidatus Solibacter usitatus]
PCLSTPEVESLIAVPIENAVNGVKGLKTLRSKSVLGLCSVVLIFQPDVNLMESRQLVQERLATLSGQLPSVARAPVILSPLSSTSRVMKIGVSSKILNQVEMTTLVRWTVRPRLMAIPGVANVAIWGQRDRQLQVLVDPQRLRDHRVTLDDVVRASQGGVSLAAGGFVETPNQRLSVTHLPAVRNIGDLAKVPVVFRNGSALTLGDVATVTEGHPPPIGDAVINDGPGLLLIVEKQLGANTFTVTKAVESVIDKMRPGLKDVEVDTTIFRPATFITMSLDNLNHALMWGCVLVILVLIAFLMEWRTALISLTAIPLSLLTAALILYYRGGTINTMILAGLAIALGEVVDDAIIDVENIMRRLRLNRAEGEPRTAFAVVLDASLEVRSAVVYATIIVALVFIPVFFLDGLPGAFFRPLAASYVLSVAASLAVALIVTPALCLILLPGSSLKLRDPLLLRGLKSGYRAMLPALLRSPFAVAAALAILLIGSGIGANKLGEEFMPKFKEFDFLMHWVEKPGTSLEAMRRITELASKELRAVPGVRNFGSHIGRAEVADEVVGPNFTELWISLDPKVDYEPTVNKIQSIVDGYPGLYRDLLTYLKERIKEVLTGGSAAIVVRMYGSELDVLRSSAGAMGESLKGIPGISDLQVEAQVLVPEIQTRLKPEAALRFGLTPGDVRRAATTLVKGVKAGEIYEGQKIFDVAVWGKEDVRRDIASLRDLRIDSPLGGNVPLGEVADVFLAPVPNLIQRENASRRIDVACNVKGRDLGSVARDIQDRVKSFPFERGYHAEVLGEYAARQASRDRLLSLSLLSILGIVLILYSDFQSTRITTIIFATLPFALIGGVVGAYLTGGVLSLGSMVGFVTVLGIAARNGIMMVSHFRELEESEGVPFGWDLVMRGAEERLSPILMTALATALALVPIVAGGNKPGQEIEHPMAVVILGGLVTSTLLNLFFLPALYLRFARRKTA